MAGWKKIIHSGSNAHLNSITASNILLDSSIIHNGDENTRIVFNQDEIKLNTNGATDLTVKSGKVGIGTTTPQKKLDVYLGTNDAVASIGGTISTGEYAGLHFGYSETGNALYRHSAIVFERDDGAFGDARGKIHLLNSSGGSASTVLGDARLTILPTGNIGIGTTSPSRKLQVDNSSGVGEVVISGTTGATLYFRPNTSYSTAGNFGIFTTGLTSGTYESTMDFKGYYNGVTTPLTIKGSGNVGIGTATPDATLEVDGNVKATSFTGSLSGSVSHALVADSVTDATLLAQSNLWYNGTTYLSSSVNVNVEGHVSASKLLGNAPNGDVLSLQLGRTDNANYWSFNHAGNDLRIYNTAGTDSDILLGVNAGGSILANKVGIGTATPAYKLDVSGNVRLKDSASEIILDNSTYSEMRYGTANYFRAAGNEAIVNGPIINFKIADSEKMRIHSDGNVGIGTATPAEKLHINGNLRLGNIKIQDTVGGRIGFNRNTTTGTIYNSSISAYQVQNEAGKFEIQSYTGYGGYLGSVFIISGSVGIGTTTPSEKLHVDGNVRVNSTQGYYGSFLQAISSTGLKIGNDDYSGYMFFKDDGNVGIGTTNPPKTLTVQGDISHSGDLFTEGDHHLGGSTIYNGLALFEDNIVVRSGSTIFGSGSVGEAVQTTTHEFTGSVRITGSLTVDENVDIAGNLDVDGTVTSNFFGSLTGTATNAGTIDGLDSLQFLRSDVDDTGTGRITLSGGLKVSGNAGDVSTSELIIQGTSPQIKFSDTVASAHDFYIHVNANKFYVLTDRDNNDNWDGTHPLELRNDTSMGLVYGNQIVTTNMTIANATNADTLDGVDSLRFLRSDQSDETTGELTVRNDNGLFIKSVTNAAGAQIRFSDNVSAYGQVGTLEYKHSNGAVTTLGGNSTDGWIFSGTETRTVVKVEGDIVAEDIYSNVIGDVTGDVTGDVVGDLTGTADSANFAQNALDAVNATNATNATMVNINNKDTGDTNCPILFTLDSTAGFKSVFEDNALYFNSTNNILYSTTFSGALTGNASTATQLSDGGGITTNPSTNHLLHTGQISAGTSGLFATINNANSIITLNKHNGHYNSQLGFSSNGKIYYRNFADQALSTNNATKPWVQILTSADVGAGSGLNADLLDDQQGSYYLDYTNFTNTPTIPTNNDQLANGAGYITSADGGNAQTLDSIDSTAFINETHTQHSAANLAVGWYTIAVQANGRAHARFGIRDTASSRHASVTFYATHHYGNGNQLTVLTNGKYSTVVFSNIRIKELGTYDGAALQVYISNASNSVVAYMLGDNYQSTGWTLKDWIPDATNPGINTGADSSGGWNLYTTAAQVALADFQQGMAVTPGNISGSFIGDGSGLTGITATNATNAANVDIDDIVNNSNGYNLVLTQNQTTGDGPDTSGNFGYEQLHVDINNLRYFNAPTTTAGAEILAAPNLQLSHPGGKIQFKSQTNDLNSEIRFQDTGNAQNISFKVNNTEYMDIGENAIIVNPNFTVGNSFTIRTGGTTTALRVSGSGDVGINTTSPTDNLFVKASGDDHGITLMRSSTTAGTYSELGFLNTTGVGSQRNAWIRGIRGAAGFSDSILAFGTGDSTEKMRILGNGNVGIGTDVPSDKLTIVGTFETRLTGNDIEFQRDNGKSYIRKQPSGIAQDETGLELVFTNHGNDGDQNSVGLVITNQQTNDNFTGWGQSNGGAVTIAAPGVYSNTNPSGASYMRIQSDGTMGRHTSDRTHKTDIENLPDALDKVKQLQPRQYKFKSHVSQSAEAAPTSIGFIAQEIKSIYPEVVQGEEGNYSVDYPEMTVIAVKALQEQQVIIEALEKRIADLENQ